MTNLNSVLKSRDNCFADKGVGPYNQSYDFSSSHVWMSELDHKEGWVPKNWCFWIVVLEKALESLLDCEEIKPINPKGNHPWIFIARIDAETEVPILWPPDVKSWLIGKDPDVGNCEGRNRRAWQRMRWLDGTPTQWTWVWANSGSRWRKEKSGMLQSMGSQRVRHDLATKQRNNILPNSIKQTKKAGN